MSNTAVLWDLNGVIIDDMRFHLEALQIVLKEFDYGLGEEEFIAKCTGTSPTDFFSRLLPALGDPISVEEAVKRKTDLYFRLIRGRMEMLPGVSALIKSLHLHGVKQAIASGATRVEVDAIIDEFAIGKYFGKVIASEDVINGKPDPEPFLKAAAGLGAKPEFCVVIEDGEFGIRAAVSCGMRVIAVTNTQSHEKLSAADVVVDSLEGIDAEAVLTLLGEPVVL